MLFSLKTFFDSHLCHAQMAKQLPQTIAIPEGVDALFDATIDVFALARMRATPLIIQEFVNNNLRGLLEARVLAQLEWSAKKPIFRLKSVYYQHQNLVSLPASHH